MAEYQSVPSEDNSVVVNTPTKNILTNVKVKPLPSSERYKQIQSTVEEMVKIKLNDIIKYVEQEIDKHIKTNGSNCLHIYLDSLNREMKYNFSQTEIRVILHEYYSPLGYTFQNRLGVIEMYINPEPIKTDKNVNSSAKENNCTII